MAARDGLALHGSPVAVGTWLPGLVSTLTKNYFTSCDPHHDIYTFSYWQILRHSI